jgi:hypothetical protein
MVIFILFEMNAMLTFCLIVKLHYWIWRSAIILSSSGVRVTDPVSKPLVQIIDRCVVLL